MDFDAALIENAPPLTAHWPAHILAFQILNVSPSLSTRQV